MFKSIKYFIFKLIYGNVTQVLKSQNNKKIILKKVSINNSHTYNFYDISNGRVYSDTVNNTAYILDNSLIKHASYQYKLKKPPTNKWKHFEKFVIKHGTKFLKYIEGCFHCYLVVQQKIIIFIGF